MKNVCLVTGANGRLGSALCSDLAGEYDVIAVYRAKVPLLNSQIRQSIPNIFEKTTLFPAVETVHCIQADLSLRQDVRRVAEVALARFGRVDAIVNAAADTRFHGNLVDIFWEDDESQRQLLINSITPFHLISAIHQASWKDAKDNAARNRSIVNVSSISGLKIARNRGQAMYAASKSALNILTLYLSVELATYSIRANAICPGRFSDTASTMRVVKVIRELLQGELTGHIVSV